MPGLLTCAVAAGSAAASTAATACSTICTAAVARTAAAGTTVVGIIVAARIAVAVNSKTARALDSSCVHPVAPFANSRPGARQESFSSFPFCACGCQSKACSYTP